MTPSVHVTEHAVSRWRERVAGWDAPAAALAAAVRAAAPLSPGDAPAGLLMRDGMAYRRDAADPTLVYVLEPLASYRGCFKLVTVYRVGWAKPLDPTVGKAAKRKARLRKGRAA